jgi:hypothetical protein
MPIGERDYRPGDELSASWLTALLKRLKRAEIRVGAGLDKVEADGGTLLRALARPPQRIVAVLNDRDGDKFSWTEQVASAGGGWTSTSRSGRASASSPGTAPVDPAYEYDLLTSPPVGSRVEMFRSTAGDWRFQLRPCDATAQSMPIPGILGFAMRRRAQSIQESAALPVPPRPPTRPNTSLITLQTPEVP